MVQYEKIPTFCFFCGMIGHEVTECGDGVHEQNRCEWGDWHRVPFFAALGGREENSHRRGRGGGRGRGRGRNQFAGSKHDVDDMETSDDDDGGSDAEKNSRMMEDLEAHGKGLVAQHVKLLENSPQDSMVMSPQKEQEKKRMKRSKDGSDVKINPESI